VFAKIRLPAFRRDKRHDGDGACAFDCDSQFSLMSGAIARDSSGHDFTAFRDKIIENHRVLIINLNIRVRAEAAELLSVKKFLLGRT